MCLGTGRKMRSNLYATKMAAVSEKREENKKKYLSEFSNNMFFRK